MKDDALILLFLVLSLISISFLTRSAYVYGLKMENELEIKIREESGHSLLNENNSNGDSSGKSWHTIAVWKFNMPTIAVFSLVDFLRLLHSSSNKIDDLDRVFTVETVQNIRTKLSKNIRKLHRKIHDIVYELVGKHRRYNRTERIC